MATSLATLIRARIRWDELHRQITISWRPLLLAAAAAAACIGAIWAFAALRDVRPDQLTRDIYYLANKPVYYGLLSMLGIMAWAASAAIWLFGWALLRRLGASRSLTALCLASGMLSLLLLGDDAFMLHEYILPVKLGIPEGLVMGIYVIIGVAYAGVGWRSVAATPYLPALCAGLCLGGSLGLDQIILGSSPVQTVIEDSLKFAGIIFWLTYACVATSASLGAAAGLREAPTVTGERGADRSRGATRYT